jgi:hypothetical protein
MAPTLRGWAVTAGPATVKAHTIHLDNRTTASPPRRTRARRTPHRPPAPFGRSAATTPRDSPQSPPPRTCTAPPRTHRTTDSPHHALTALAQAARTAAHRPAGCRRTLDGQCSRASTSPQPQPTRSTHLLHGKARSLPYPCRRSNRRPHPLTAERRDSCQSRAHRATCRRPSATAPQWTSAETTSPCPPRRPKPPVYTARCR